MRLDRSNRRRLQLQNVVFVLLVLALVGVLAWLATELRVTADWSQTQRNTLTAKSREVVQNVEGPIRISAYIRPEPVTRSSIRKLIERYRRAGAAIELEFINPETNPGIARELGIREGGELILQHNGGEQRLQRISEQSITNALVRLARGQTRWLVFLSGHGERDPLGEANHDLGRFGERLQQRGFRVQTHSLARNPHIPDNADLLVIASPQSAYLPGERARIRQYVRAGGHLLWLTEPDAETALGPLAADLGVRRLPGTVVDAGAKLFGADSPDFAVVDDYGDHPITAGLDQLSVFPQAAALSTAEGGGWHGATLLRTRAESWSETGPIEGEIGFDEGSDETRGPLTLAVAKRRGPSGEHAGEAESGQRIAVVGDGDFLANAYLGNGVNLDLGMRLVNWLIGDENQLRIPPDTPTDARVTMSRTAVYLVGFGFLIGLPLLLLVTGLVLGYRRRRR